MWFDPKGKIPAEGKEVFTAAHLGFSDLSVEASRNTLCRDRTIDSSRKGKQISGKNNLEPIYAFLLLSPKIQCSVWDLLHIFCSPWSREMNSESCPPLSICSPLNSAFSTSNHMLSFEVYWPAEHLHYCSVAESPQNLALMFYFFFLLIRCEYHFCLCYSPMATC